MPRLGSNHSGLLPFKMLQHWMPALLFLSVAFTDVHAQDTSCFPVIRFDDGGAHCLSLIRQKSLDTAAFPFSTPFATLCPPEERESRVQCFGTPERLPLNQRYSLSMLAFGTPCSVDPLTGLDRYLYVGYVSLPGNYSGCDTKYTTLDKSEFELDPLSDLPFPSWTVREIPTFRWRAENDELFTLLFVDFESKVLQAAFVNIRGNDMANSLVLQEYLGPGNMRPNPRVYTFVLYKQRGLIFSEPIPAFNFNITSLVQRHNLQGPVGINWMMVEADANSVRNAQSMFGLQNCASLVQKEFEKNRPDLPFLTQPYDLKVHLRVRFTSDEFTYTCGSLLITHPGSDFYLDPIGNPILNAADVRNEASRRFYMEMNKANPNNEIDFAGKLYTMMIVAEAAPWLHGLSINIHGDDVTSGTVIVPYRQPQPSSVHTYYFLLFEQKTEISLAATAGFTYNKCLDGVVQAFISVNKLQLVGATWMRADNNNYVQCVRTS